MNHLTDMAAKRAEIAPDAIAFHDYETKRDFSFQEINDRSNRLANLILDKGFVAGERIAVLCHNHPDFFVLMFAAQKSGLVLVPLNWRQPAAELEPVLAASGARLLFCDGAFSELGRVLSHATGAELCAMGATPDASSALDALLAGAAERPVGSGHISADAPWYLLYTSGTTGRPKAVIQTAGMAYANMINYCQPAGLAAGEQGINFLPLFHTAGINLPTLPVFLNGGMSTVLRKFDPDTVLDLIHAGRVTCFFAVPAVYQALALSERIGATDFSAVRSLGCGGAPVPGHLLKDFQTRGVTICNGMGMTETGPTIFLMDKAHAALKIGSIGKPQLLADVRIVDGNGDAIDGPGEGEAQFRGPNVTPGYLDDPDATAAAFTQDGWLRSGDVARRDEDGYFYIVDRIKDMYISGGENVYPAEVEQVLAGHPAILEAAVIGVADRTWGEAGAAFLIVRPGKAVDTATLDGWCRERLAAYKVPKRFTVVEDLPRTAAGKVQKNVLKEVHSDALREADEKAQGMMAADRRALPAVFFWTPAQADFDAFAALSGDDNPIHVDPAFSARTRFGRTVSHGMLLYARVHAWLEKLFPGRRHELQNLMFPNPAYAGEELAFHFSPDPEQADNVLIEVRRRGDDAVTLSGSCRFGADA